jgi:hypothetical protein
VHPGVLVAKVGYFGVKSAKVLREQMAWAHQHLLKWVRAKHAFFLTRLYKIKHCRATQPLTPRPVSCDRRTPYDPQTDRRQTDRQAGRQTVATTIK